MSGSLGLRWIILTPPVTPYLDNGVANKGQRQGNFHLPNDTYKCPSGALPHLQMESPERYRCGRSLISLIGKVKRKILIKIIPFNCLLIRKFKMMTCLIIISF